MAKKPISGFNQGIPNGQIELIATDPNDKTSSPAGTTLKYVFTDIINYIMTSFGLHAYTAALVGTTGDLSATYDNGSSGIGATLTNNSTMTALALDEVTVPIGSRVLVKDQLTQFENGIYIVTNPGSNVSNWVLTRATDFNQPSQIFDGGIIIVNQGTLNGGIMFQQTQSGPFTIGVTAITFAVFDDIGFTGGGSNSWINVSNPSETMSKNLGFTVDNGASLVTFTTPATCAVGDWNEINGSSSGGWTLVAGPGQTLIGNGGPVTSISSSNQYDSVGIRCIDSNTSFSVVFEYGSLIYV